MQKSGNKIAITGASNLIVQATEDIEASAIGGFCMLGDFIVATSALHATENTFNTGCASVFYDATTGTFSDTSTTGYYKVGILQEVKDSAGVIRILMDRNAETVA